MKCNATVKFLFIGLYFAVSLLLLFGNPVDDSAIVHVVYYGFVIANLYNASRLIKALEKKQKDNGDTIAENRNGISERSD